MQYPYEEITNLNNMKSSKENIYFPIIERKIKINSLYNTIKKEILITSILEQRIKSIILLQRYIRGK